MTAALPYANGALHFGHIAGAYLPADCYARFCRLLGDDVLYVCGSDEHGVPITLTAEMANRTPQEHVDLYHQINLNLFQKFHISFDHYSRTTWEGHLDVTQQFFKELLENGYIESKNTDQLYSLSDERFLADRYVLGTCPKCGFEDARGDECTSCGHSYEAVDLKNPRSKLTGAKLVLRSTKHWFLRFDLFKEKLSNWIKTKSWKGNVTAFVQNYIDNLHPRAITRDLNWGIPVPLDEAQGKVFYVWFDAPIGYISATMHWSRTARRNPDDWKKYWLDPDTHYVQFVGKDNIPFHAIFFPAMQMGQNTPYKLVDELVANEFYHLEGKQFSKSNKWGIDLDQFFNKFSSDQIRYTIASNAPESQDSEFSWKDFQMRCNSELLGKYGNLVHRVFVFVHAHLGGNVPPVENLLEEDRKFLGAIQAKAENLRRAYTSFQMRKATQLIMGLASLANVYFDAKMPWKSIRDPSQKSKMETTLACCLHALHILALTSFPIIPETAKNLWKMLGYKKPLENACWNEAIKGGLPHTNRLNKPKILFQKVEDEMIQEEMQALEKKREGANHRTIPPFKKGVSFDNFANLDLRVGQIVHAELVPKSHKLLKLEVDFGLEKRTIVSGIAKRFPKPDILVGKKSVFVVNLEPVKLMGIESRGMLLIGGSAPCLELLELADALPGDPIT